MKSKQNIMPGLFLCLLLAVLASFLAKLSIGDFSLGIIGAPVFAIFIGMIISLFQPQLASHSKFHKGISFSSKKILQGAVILLGFSLNLSMIIKVGGKSLPVIISTISIALLVAWFFNKKLDMETKLATLIGVGSAICGGSAIAATAPVIKADDKQVAQAISVIFIFNVLAALLFPVLGYNLGLGSEGFAIFAGSAVNDTSSVTAAAATAENFYQVEGILSAAVTVKLTRTLAIIPITIGLSIIQAGKENKSSKTSIFKLMPTFILYFILAAVITSTIDFLPANSFTTIYGENFIPLMKLLAKFFITMAMTAIGLNAQLHELIKEGKKPIILGLSCWIAISLVSLSVQALTATFYSNLT
ncbi:YeiH family protein [Facklamia sp. 7083-14-GEN3]|uniref:YeiH family protein n=1 Tax=Facklamia sp. 7083-14-GEN3 TaxID=2973478 RepID=UPI00215C2224|nr:putative sulfate exporter family transporter [Facklamia sp. 7083-14-GEN3]MCR8968497.1 putative sulfate exporter family transporter [Facklamia sp. 7083-14-GEN3]